MNDCGLIEMFPAINCISWFILQDAPRTYSSFIPACRGLVIETEGCYDPVAGGSGVWPLPREGLDGPEV
jgi:hypothetical protein